MIEPAVSFLISRIMPLGWYIWAQICVTLCIPFITVWYAYRNKGKIFGSIARNDRQFKGYTSIAITILLAEITCEVNASYYNTIRTMMFLSILFRFMSSFGTRNTKTPHKPKRYGVLRGILITIQILFALMVFLRGTNKKITKIRRTRFCDNYPASVASLTTISPRNGVTMTDGPGPSYSSFVSALVVLIAIYWVVLISIAALEIYDYEKSKSQNLKDDISLGSAQNDGRDLLNIYVGFIILIAGSIYTLVTRDVWHLRSWMDANGWLGQNNRDNSCTWMSFLVPILLGGAPIVLIEAILKRWKGKDEGDHINNLGGQFKESVEGQVLIEKQKVIV